tara:strand:+ start:1410 stop:1898 length:489 start_codon:yes stop_codon:yes gene_type:complete
MKFDYMSISLANERETQDLGFQMAGLIEPPLCVYLEGEIGAGKTSLVRSILRGVGFKGPVKSPTFTLVESYQFQKKNIYHFDLFRIDNPIELEHLGVEQYLGENSILLFEWPDKGLNHIPLSDLNISITVSLTGRELLLQSKTKTGNAILSALGKSLGYIGD